MRPGRERDRGAAGATELVALVVLVALVASGVQALGLPGWVSCVVGEGVSSVTGGPGPAGRCAGRPSPAGAGGPDVGHQPGERFTARTFRSGPAVLQGVHCTDSTYTRTCIEDGVLRHCSFSGCPEPGRVPLAAFSRCAAAPVTTRDEGAPARLLCALQVPDRDEPHLVECVSDAGGVWVGGAAAGCTDTTDSALDPGAGANLVADCRVVSFDALQDEQVHVDVRWACADWAGRVYACTGSVEIPLDASADLAVDVREAAGRRAQGCATRTFGADGLSCSPVGADGQVSCQAGDEMDLTCAVLSADEREVATSSTWGRPTTCVRADHRSPSQAALERCTEAIGTSTPVPVPSPGRGRGATRGLRGAFDPAPGGSGPDDVDYLDGLIDEVLAGIDDEAPAQELPATTVRPPSLATACAAAVAGDVIHGVWSPGGGAFVTSPLAVEHVEHPVAGAPADQVSPLAHHVGQLQQVVSALDGPSPATGATIPPVPPVVATDQADVDTLSSGGGIGPPFIIVNGVADQTNPAVLAHEYGHVLAGSLGFTGTDWQTGSLHEGFADSFALLALRPGEFHNLGRENQTVGMDDVAPEKRVHHNGVLLLNVVQDLRGPGGTDDRRLRQLLVETAADPRARGGFSGFRAAMIAAAARLGMDVAAVEEALDSRGWTVDAPPGSCSTVTPLPRRGPDDPGAGGFGGSLVAGLGVGSCLPV